MRSLAGQRAGRKGDQQADRFILHKIKEVDEFLRARHELYEVVREVHPEVCLRELAGRPMVHSKKRQPGRKERVQALRLPFSDIDVIVNDGRKEGLPLEDILDATVACWSALRLAEGKGRSLIEPVPHDMTGLPMTIWV